MRGTRTNRAVLCALNVVCIVCAGSAEARAATRNFARAVLQIETVDDWAISSVWVTMAYTLTYLIAGGLFEYTNPTPKTPERMQSMRRQLRLGVGALVCNVVYATTWIWLIDTHTPFYGYFAEHPYTAGWLIANILWYLFFMDSFFYWSHRVLHIRKPVNLWYTIHRFHHQFVDPTAYAQDAVHPLEAIIQGPMPHYLAGLFMPIHPLLSSTLGFLTSLYAIAAHDGRSLDLNSHIKHHHYKNCNFGLYWALWDHICGTRYSPERFPKRLTSFDDEPTETRNGHHHDPKAS